MTVNASDHEYFPADFSQLYALGYAELCVYIESFLEGDLTQAELSDHYRHQLHKHTDRLEVMCKASALGIRTSIAAARQE